MRRGEEEKEKEGKKEGSSVLPFVFQRQRKNSNLSRNVVPDWFEYDVEK